MADEEFDELLNGPLSHPMIAFRITRLVMALRHVVDRTGEEGAKALVIKADKTFRHLVISAAKRIDNNRLRRELGARKIRFARPEEVKELTGCMPGAVPPFGNLFGLDVYMDDALLDEETVYFNCGSHTISLRMSREDLVKATEARVISFART